MHIYLAQHGQALSVEQDPQRPLSDEGRAAAKKVAKYLATLGTDVIDPPIREVRHSGKLRAQQTAEIFAEALGPSVTLRAVAGMNPNDGLQAVYEDLALRRDQEAPLLLVGHLPHLELLVGVLLTGDAEKAPVRFVNAAVLRISWGQEGWAVDWYVTPACVP